MSEHEALHEWEWEHPLDGNRYRYRITGREDYPVAGYRSGSEWVEGASPIALVHEILRLAGELDEATVPDNWTPTAENVNALPDPVRVYIHDLATRCDPSGDVQRLALAEDTARALHAENAELRRALEFEGADPDE